MRYFIRPTMKNQISYKTFKHEIFNQTNQNQIYHENFQLLDIKYIGFIHSFNQSNKQDQSDQLKTLTNQFK